MRSYHILRVALISTVFWGSFACAAPQAQGEMYTLYAISAPAACTKVVCRTFITTNADLSMTVNIVDPDGNQTVIHTSLGSWDVEYDAENRPVSFSTSSWGGSVTMSYDFMGRRFMKCSLGAPGPDQWSSREFFSYNNYLQIERFNDYDVINSTVWDPTDLKNSKPLGIKWWGVHKLQNCKK